MQDPEAVARWVYGRTFCSLSHPPGPAGLLERLIGADRIRFGGAAVVVDRRADGFWIDIPRGLPKDVLCIRLALAVARVAVASHWRYKWSDLSISHVAMAIVMPREAVRLVLLAGETRTAAVAAAFVVPHEVAASRLRELGLGVVQSGEFRKLDMPAAG